MKIHIDRKYIPVAATALLAILLYLAVGFTYTNFMTLRVFVNFFRDNAFLGIIAVGMTFVILSGGIDLSVGSMIAFTSVLTAFLMEKQHLHPLIVLPFALICGALIGFSMGCLIHFFKSPPFIVTLAGMFFCRGMANVISLEQIPIYHPFFRNITRFGFYLTDRIRVPADVIIFFIIFIIGMYVAHFTRFGRNVYAIGGNSQSALLMGLPVGRTKIAIYTLSGFLSALAGIVYTMNTPAGNGLAGVGVELDAIACVVIGGTLLTGGVGYLAGTFIGVLIQAIIKTFLSFNGALSSWWTKIAIGLLLLVFILLQRILSQASRLNKAKSAVVQTAGLKKTREVKTE